MGNIMSYDGVDITEKPFGGVFVVSGSDFRQILPMIRKGCKQDILASSINSSKLWRHYGIRSANESGEINLLIPDEFLIKDSSDPLRSRVDFVYPDFLKNMKISDIFFKRGGYLLPH
ncbi:PIF1-like helicase [Medicago truncatula]|uniref:ATP-dependent DNA helicase n=1 Tax=Medicago truncatula TaxID=3880 RepID=A0A072U9K6_MEDTR|nr:PIF1-like helicase [Medicago truncatula]